MCALPQQIQPAASTTIRLESFVVQLSATTFNKTSSVEWQHVNDDGVSYFAQVAHSRSLISPLVMHQQGGVKAGEVSTNITKMNSDCWIWLSG